MGKSTLATNIAENAAIDHGKPVALFSLEMSETELAHRFIASQAKVSSDELRKGRVKADRWPKVLRAVEKLAAAPIFIDDSSDIGVLEMRAKARRLHARHGGLGLIVVDYLQLVRPDGRSDSRVEQVGQISRGLKILARELDIPVVAVSQLSRAVESRHPPVPMLSDLRESGQLEQDADVVMFVYREEYYDQESERLGEADIIFAKHRNGPIGKVTLSFLPKYPRFASLYRDHGAVAGDARRQRSRLTCCAGWSPRSGHLPLRGVRRVDLGARRGDRRRPALPLPRAARAQGRQRRRRHRHRAGASWRCPSTASRSCRSTRSCCGRCAPSCARSATTSTPAAGVWFDGPVGTGKTSLAILVAKAAKDAGRSYAVYPVPRLLAEIKRTFDRDASDTYLGFFRRLCTVDVLVLDDLGAEKQTEWVLEQLYSIVNERWQDRRSIVVTTNIPDADPDAPGAHAAGERPRSARSRRARPDGRDLDELRRIVDRVERGRRPGWPSSTWTAATTRSCGCAGRSARAPCRGWSRSATTRSRSWARTCAWRRRAPSRKQPARPAARGVVSAQRAAPP